jgi:deazaflavin-dependent oxidoreductase (nitroreductase family)
MTNTRLIAVNEVRMPFPRWLARFNLYVTNRILSPLARFVPGMAVVVHLGRRSHRPYRTPVMVFRREHDFLIALTYGRESQWVQNVLAQGGCELQTKCRWRLRRPECRTQSGLLEFHRDWTRWQKTYVFATYPSQVTGPALSPFQRCSRGRVFETD